MIIFMAKGKFILVIFISSSKLEEKFRFKGVYSSNINPVTVYMSISSSSLISNTIYIFY